MKVKSPEDAAKFVPKKVTTTTTKMMKPSSDLKQRTSNFED